MIEAVQRPTLVLAPNKTLAAQLYGEMKSFFPDNAVEYFVSYYDYYQPEAYVPRSDTYIEKESSVNEAIDRMRPKKKKDIDIAERNADFPTVEKLFRIIDSDTVTAIVDKALVQRLEAYEKITRAELQSASVQIWHSKEQQFGLERLERVRGYDDLRKWKLEYDRFLGYMSGVLPLIDGGNDGLIV